jgi:hypothetical protein
MKPSITTYIIAALLLVFAFFADVKADVQLWRGIPA